MKPIDLMLDAVIVLVYSLPVIGLWIWKKRMKG